MHDSGVSANDIGQRRLLVVEDEAALARLLTVVLGTTYELVFAADGLEAVAVLESDTPLDCVLLDVMLPRLDGSQVFRRLVELRPDLRPRTLVMTGSGTHTPEVESLRAAGLPILLKPFAPAELLAALTVLLDPAAVPVASRATPAPGVRR